MPETSKKAVSAKRATATAKKPSSKTSTVKATAATARKSPAVKKSPSTERRPVEIRTTKAALPPAGPNWISKSSKKIGRAVKTLTFWAWVVGIIVVVFIALVMWWQWQRSYVAVVGGQYISTAVMDDQLRANYGTNGVTAVVQQQLVLQEGQRQHVTISDKAINTEINKIKTSSGGNESYQGQLRQLGISENLLRFQVKVQLTREALLKDKIQPTAKEVQDYYDANKDTLDPDSKGLNSVKSKITETLKQQKLDQATPDYLDTLQQRTHTETDLSHLSLTFGDFLNQTVWPIPTQIWNFVTGKK